MTNDRQEQDPKLQWRLSDLYENTAAWERALQEAQAQIAAIEAYRGRLGESADTLLAVLRNRSAAERQLVQAYTYAHLHKDTDNGNATYQGMTDRAMQAMVAAQAALSFIEPEILEIAPETLRAWAQEPRFQNFRFYLEDLDRQRAHLLSAAEERILAMAEDPLSGADNAFTMLSDVDLDFGTVVDAQGQEVKLTHSTYGLLLESPDRRVRRDAFRNLYKAYRSVKNTIAATYAASVKADVFRARVRGYAGSLEAALDGNNVPVAVYEQLIEAVHEKLPALQKYLALRKRQLKLDQLEMYDLYTPIVPECSMPMTYEEAKALVKEALKPLGERYGRLLDEAYENHWIDVYESAGKTSGAFSWGVYGVHPFVLLNHQDNVDHAFTLAHELGHAMHSYHSNEKQPYETADYRIMVAEVASTVNETLMMQYLLGHETDPVKRAYLINQQLESYRTTCFRQTMFAEFELKAHRMAENGEPLTVESLSRVYRELNELYYVGVVADDDIASEWMRIPHFYNAFYVYQYATGICTATALARDILEHGGAPRYLDFLSSGGSDYPIRLLQNAGVDLTDKASIASALEVFEQGVDELEQLLK